jgi:hypothetical protein
VLRRKIALAVALCVTASLVLAGAVVARGGDRNHDRIPDRWEKRHNLSLKVKQHRRDQDSDGLENRGEWRAKLDPRDDDTDDDGIEDGDENAGTIASFEDDVLTLNLAGGGTLAALVTDRTDIECDDDAGDDRGHDGKRDDDDDDGHHGDGDHDGDDARVAHGGRRHHDDGEDCGSDALTAGAVVLEAELKVRGGKAGWTELEVLGESP